MIHQASTSEHRITVEKSTSKQSVPTTPQAEKKNSSCLSQQLAAHKSIKPYWSALSTVLYSYPVLHLASLTGS